MFGCTAVHTQKANVAVQLKRRPQVPRPRGSGANFISPTGVWNFSKVGASVAGGLTVVDSVVVVVGVGAVDTKVTRARISRMQVRWSDILAGLQHRVPEVRPVGIEPWFFMRGLRTGSILLSFSNGPEERMLVYIP
jgi:hypothetical protein